MFDWLFEAHRHPAVYVFLAAAAVLFVVLWVRTKKRRWLAAALVPAALAGLYYLLDIAVETDSEQIERKVNAMAAGFKKPADLDAVFANVSDQFQAAADQATNKAALRDLVQRDIPSYGIDEVKITDFRAGEISREKNSAEADFRAKVLLSGAGGPDAVPVHCDATFDYDAAHGWRMRTLKVKGEGPFQGLEWPP